MRISPTNGSEIMEVVPILSNVVYSTGSGYCVWNVYAYSTNLGLYCGPMTLYNILKNMGYNDFSSWTDLSSNMASTLGITSAMTIEDYHMRNYLSNKNYHFSYNTSGYMSLGNINTMTYINHRYGIAFSQNPSTGLGHITGIIGYSSSSSGDYVILFDPHGSGNCRLTVSLSSRIFTSSGTQYYWNYGYISNIYK